jgi:plastocyanin
MANRSIYIIIAVVVIVIIVAGVLVYVFMNPSGGGGGGGTLTGTNIDIYAGESSRYGFGSSSSNIGSPGPQMVLTHGQTVTVTLHNVGTMSHNWAITNDKVDGSTNLPFSGAQIGSASNPVAAGGTQSVTFTVGNAGNYYYICQVDGHVSLGMWGTVIVN